MSGDTLATEARFAIVPEWVLFAKVPHLSVRLYAVLARHADENGVGAFPSRRRLGELLGAHPSTIDRALGELVGIGAVSVSARYRPDGGQTSNAYTLRVVPPMQECVGGLSADAEGPSAPVRNQEREPVNETPGNDSQQQKSERQNQVLPVAQHVAPAVVERLEVEVPAAAPESEPVSLERAVASLTLLSGWDSGSLAVVEPLLMQVPDTWFRQALQAALQRRSVRNRTGLFIYLLRTAIKDWRQAQQKTQLARWDELFGEAGIEHVKRTDPRRYVLAWAKPSPDVVKPLPASAVVQHVFDYVHEYVPDPSLRRELLKLFAETVDRPPAFGDVQGWVLFQIDREGRPIDDVLAVIRAAVPDEHERERLTAFAREIHLNIEQERSNAA